MASHGKIDMSHDITRLRPGNRALGMGLMIVGIAALIGAYVTAGDQADGRRFWYAYLFGLIGLTTISCAALVFVLVKTLVHAGWVTNVRRIIETMAMQVVLAGILSLPVVFITLKQDGTIYSWAVPSDTPIVHHGGHGESHGDSHADHGHDHAGHHDGETPEEHAKHVNAEKAKVAAKPQAADGHGHGESHDAAHASTDAHAGHSHPGHSDAESPGEHSALMAAEEARLAQIAPGALRPYDKLIAEKRGLWLNPTFWAARIVIYFAVLSAVAWFYYSRSTKQDATGDIDLSYQAMKASAPMLIAVSLVVTFIGFDMYMSLDPHWFSTMYGVYFFASGAQAMWSIVALTVLVLQARGYITESVSVEHRQDIGKFMFTFVVFFAYIAYSQYMLQWYANLPEETFWYDKRGYSTANPNTYSGLAIALLVGRFIVPFFGLVSRWVKRSKFGLAFWAVWLLAMFVVDMALLVLPEYSTTLVIGAPEVLGFGGIAILAVGNCIRMASAHELRPIRDPRTHESMALMNI